MKKATLYLYLKYRPTSIDPSQDPGYSSWGKDPASVNYIGFIAYLVKANNAGRVKALETN